MLSMAVKWEVLDRQQDPENRRDQRAARNDRAGLRYGFQSYFDGVI
jgi:hypothetical protein